MYDNEIRFLDHDLTQLLQITYASLHLTNDDVLNKFYTLTLEDCWATTYEDLTSHSIHQGTCTLEFESKESVSPSINFNSNQVLSDNQKVATEINLKMMLYEPFVNSFAEMLIMVYLLFATPYTFYKVITRTMFANEKGFSYNVFKNYAWHAYFVMSLYLAIMKYSHEYLGFFTSALITSWMVELLFQTAV